MRRFLAWASLLAALSTGRPAAADDVAKRWSYNDFGGVGLLQTRTARFADDGELAIGYTRVEPHEGGFITFQALPWLEGTFRYERFAQKPPESDRFDRSLDAKIRLFEEGSEWPAVAIGFQDMLGTGIFSGEYLVASKRYYDFDFSLGIGWGRLGSRGDFKNPLTLFSDSFETRSAETGLGGEFRLGDFFSGRKVGIFGGIEYITPIEGLRLKVEYDGNAYQRERELAPDFESNSRFNFGIEYRPFSWLDLALAYEHGDAVMVRVTAGANVKTAKAPPKFGSQPVPPLPRPKAEQRLKPEGAAGRPGAAVTLRRGAGTARRSLDADVATFFSALEVAGLEVVEVDHSGSTLRITLDKPVPAAQLARAKTIALQSAELLPLPVTAIELVSPLPAAPRTPRPRPAAQLIAREETAPTVVQAAVPAAQAAPPKTEAGSDAVRAILEKDLPPQGFVFYGVDLGKREATVFLANLRYPKPAVAIGRAARVIANALPASIEVITIVEWSQGLEIARTSILRRDLERALTFNGSAEEIWRHTEFTPPTGAVPPTTAPARGTYPRFEWGLAPASRQSLFDPKAPVLYQLFAALDGKVELARGLELSGKLGFNIVNNFERSRRSSDSKLPHVRSDIAQYLKEGENNIVNLQANYMWNLAPDVYARVTGGLLEHMYGGISTEVLYRPYGERWALGLDLNKVWQRDFDQLFDFRDYNILTGHLNVYYQTPYNDYLIGISAGRYLAGDWGATFQLLRKFDSGVTVGGFVTITDVSAEDFGEGSFDKGIFLSIPLDLFFTRYTKRRVNLVLRPLTRDGGQQVFVNPRLYDVTDQSRYRAVQGSWRDVLE